MIHLSERANKAMITSATVTLPIDKRIKSRLRVELDDGREAGIVLTRGEVLQHGDKLKSVSGDVVEVIAAEETLSVVRCCDMRTFARACYHLGNRHVPVQIVTLVTDADYIDNSSNTAGTTPQTDIGTVSYLHDHVLDDMLRGFGLDVSIEQAPFNPEPGAYGGGHVHSHAH